jgi:hypothetical protein
MLRRLVLKNSSKLYRISFPFWYTKYVGEDIASILYKLLPLPLRASLTVWQILFPKSRCLSTPKIIWGGKKRSHLQQFGKFCFQKLKNPQRNEKTR